MNAVKDIQTLIQLIHSREEIIVFPIGGEGQQLLDFLRYANFLHRICCIAAPKVDGDNTEQKNIHEVPVIPFEHLMHFRETAIFIVAGNEQYYPQINEGLTLYGCKMFVFVTNELHAQIRDALQRMASSGQMIMWFMNQFDRKFKELEYRIEEQHEVCRVNTAAFAEYRNAFRGKEVVILGNGPTLNYYKTIPDAIHIGLNLAWKREDIPLDYTFVIDGLGNKRVNREVEKGFKRVRNRVFHGRYAERIPYSFLNYSEDISLNHDRIAHFILNDNRLGQLLHQDICCYPVSEFGGVHSPAFHFAVFTYPKKLYLVGCDVASIGHFYDLTDKVDKTIPHQAMIRVGYARMKMFARLYYPETEIISINPVGLRGLFKDVYTDEYLKALEEEKKSSEQLKEG